jgi:hypothetical protein
MKPKDGILNKILTGVLVAFVMAILSWGIWVTGNAYAVNGLKLSASENEKKIEKESENRQKQIKDRMDKQDTLLQNQDKKLSDIYILLINMKNKGEGI